MECLKDKDKRSGVITTVVIHLLILLLFIFTGLTIPVPLPEQGILINFGTSDEGMGDVQPEEMTSAEVAEDPNEEVIESTPVPTETQEEIITQDELEAPALNEVPPTPVETEVVEEKEPDPVVNPAALYSGKQNTDASDSYQGETGDPGDQGSEDGVHDSKNYGESRGNKSGFFLSGRAIVFKPEVIAKTQERGKVVVKIWVDRYGKVKRATPGAKGSTTTSSHLYKIAKEAAIKAQFSPNRDAPEEQKGTLVFDFKLRQ